MRLADCFIDLFGYVAYLLKSVETRQPSYEQVRADVQRLISQSEEKLKEGTFNMEDFDTARFAVCAWVDESILNSTWINKDRWQGEQLQRLYYHTTDAGEIFFERLNALGAHQMDVREVYYLCLALGFKGRYCQEGDDLLLEQLQTSNLKLLTGSSIGLPSLGKTELFQEAYPVESQDSITHKAPFRLSLFTLSWIGAPIVLFFGLMLIYWFVLKNYGESVIGSLH
jgi:type VI secretion system protein ImpK